VGHGRKLGFRIGANPLSRGVWGGQPREGLLQGDEAPEKGVVLAIRDFRPGLHIVEVVVALNGATKILGKGLRLGPGQDMDWGIEIQFFLRQRGLRGASGFSDETIKGNLVA
jgi:hypothetical protein